MSDRELSEMETMLRQMDSLLEVPDNLEQWSQENQRFHYSLCDWGGTLLMKSLLSKVLNHWDRLRHYYLRDVLVKRLDLSQRDHWELFEALRSRDADRAEQIVRRHNQRALADYMEYLKSTGQIENTQ